VLRGRAGSEAELRVELATSTVTDVGTVVLTSTLAEDDVVVTRALSMQATAQPAPAVMPPGPVVALAAALSASAATSEPISEVRVRVMSGLLGLRRLRAACLNGKPASPRFLTVGLSPRGLSPEGTDPRERNDMAERHGGQTPPGSVPEVRQERCSG
jgi:hypothetical protein